MISADPRRTVRTMYAFACGYCELLGLSRQDLYYMTIVTRTGLELRNTLID